MDGRPHEDCEELLDANRSKPLEVDIYGEGQCPTTDLKRRDDDGDE